MVNNGPDEITPEEQDFISTYSNEDPAFASFVNQNNNVADEDIFTPEQKSRLQLTKEELQGIKQGLKEFGPDFIKGVKSLPKGIRDFFSSDEEFSFDKPKSAFKNLYFDAQARFVKQFELIDASFDSSLTQEEKQQARDDLKKLKTDELNTVVNFASFATTSPIFLASRAKKYVELRKKGKTAEQATKDITSDVLVYGTVKVGNKVYGKVREGLAGTRVNPLTGVKQVKVQVKLNAKEWQDLAIKIGNNGNVTVRERQLFEAVKTQLKQVRAEALKAGKKIPGKSEIINKPFKVWVDEGIVATPVKPRALLEARADAVNKKINKLTNQIDFKKANSVKDVKGQLLAKDPLINKMKKVAKTGEIKEFSPLQKMAIQRKGELINNMAETVWNSPQGKLTKQMVVPNAFKNNMKTFSKEDLAAAGIYKESTELLQNTSAGIERTITTPEAFFSALDGDQVTAKLAIRGEQAGPFVENFWQPYKQLFKQKVNIQDSFTAKKVEVLDTFPQNYKQLSDVFDGKTFSFEQKINAIALSKDPVNATKLKSQGISPSILSQMKVSVGLQFNQDVAENLSVKAVYDYFAQGKPLVSKTIQDMTGEVPYLPENYVPLYNATNRGNPSYDSREVKTLQDLTGTRPNVSTSRAKKKQKNVRYILDLNLEAGMDRYANEVSRYVMIPYHNRSVKLLNDIAPTLADEYSPFVVKNIREWINDVTVGAPATFGEFDKVIDKVRLTGYGFILSRNPTKIGAIQAASAFNGADLVGYENFAKASIDILAEPPLMQAIRDESPIMRTRFAHLEAQEKALQTNAGTEGLKRVLTTAERAYVSALGIQTSLMDRMIAGSTYLAAKQKWLKLHPGDQVGAINFAEDVVGVTQPMTQEGYRPPLTRRNAGGKLIAAFHTQRNQVGSQLVVNNNAFRNGKIGPGEWAKTNVNYLLMPGIFLGMVKLGFTPKNKKRFAKASDHVKFYARTIAGSLPLLSTFLGHIEYGKGEINIAGFRPIEFTAGNMIKINKNRELIEALALGFESFAAMRGYSFQVPKNIAAVVTTTIEGDPDFQRLFKSGYERGKREEETEKEKKARLKRKAKREEKKAKKKAENTTGKILRKFIQLPKKKKEK